MQTVMRHIQKRVIELMAVRSITLADLAGRTGRSHSDVRRSLVQPHSWRLNRLFEYAEALQVAVTELVPEELQRPSSISATPDLETDRSPLERMAAAEAAGRVVLELNRLGATGARRQRRSSHRAANRVSAR